MVAVVDVVDVVEPVDAAEGFTGQPGALGHGLFGSHCVCGTPEPEPDDDGFEDGMLYGQELAIE